MTNRLLQEQFLQLTLTVVLVTILVGCKPNEPVVKHRIPKSRWVVRTRRSDLVS